MTFVSDRSFYGFYGCRQQQDKTTTRQDNNSVELVASLAPAEAEIGALAKAKFM